MAFVLLFALLAILAKSTVYLGVASEIIRLGAIAAAGVAGGAALAAVDASRLRRAWPVALWLGWLLISSALSIDPVFSLFQATSLGAVVVAACAVFARNEPDRTRDLDRICSVLLAVVTLVLASSLMRLYLDPEGAFDRSEAVYGGEARFRGLFSKPAELGLAAALLIGLAWFRLRSLILRLPLIALGGACLALTLSRTPLLGALLAMALVYALTLRRAGSTIVVVALTGLLLGGALLLGGGTRAVEAVERFGRLDTLTNLTGRVELWETAAEAVSLRPIVGQGFTLGGAAFVGPLSDGGFGAERSILDPDNASRRLGRATTHNGFLQSALDTGLVGLGLYLLVIALALWRSLLHARARPIVGYTLTLLALANVFETIVYGASSFSSALFWIFACYAITQAPSSDPSPAGTSIRVVETALPRVLR